MTPHHSLKGVWGQRGNAGAGRTTHRDAPRMGSKYPRSMRGCLPLWTLILEAALIVIFFFFANYDSSSTDPKRIVVTHGGECPEGRWSQRHIGAGAKEVCGPPGA